MQNIKHLYWRAGFGLALADWQERRNWSVQRAVDQLFDEAGKDRSLANIIADASVPAVNPDMEQLSREESRREARRKLMTDTNSWISLMVDENSSSLKHRMMLFWHGHFACRIRQPILALRQLQVLEEHALGNFRDLVLAIARDPAMIRYLNNQQNKKQTPNENFARELMELFTIGRGNYSEQDIKEAARAFTGWSSDLQGNFIFRKGQHDFDRKTFMGKSGDFDGSEIIDIILERKETAYFLTRKIYRHFVNEQVDEQKVRTLAEDFYRSGYQIGQLMHRIFSSDWFYATHNQSTQIKAPVVLLAGMLRSLSGEFSNPRTPVIVQRSLGQELFNPPNVAGWPGGKSWIDNSTLLLRLNLPVFLLQAVDAGLRPKDEFEAEKRSGPTQRIQADVDLSGLGNWLQEYSPLEAAQQLADYLLVKPVALPAALKNKLSRQQDTTKLLPLILIGIMSMPEYQLC